MRIEISYIIFCIIFFSSCNSDSTYNTLEHIKGDWYSASKEYYGKEGMLIFNFEDTLCSYEYPWGRFSSYSVNQDSLYIRERLKIEYGDTSGGHQILSFKIKCITDSSIILMPNSTSAQILGFGSYNESREYKLLKIRKKNSLHFTRLGFYCSGCLGYCPSMYLEIDSSGILLFDGISHTGRFGLHSAKLTTNQMAIINNKINLLNLENLKQFYSMNNDMVCEGPRRIIYLDISNRIYELHEHCAWEPIEPNIIFHTLMELHNFATMKQDSTILNDFIYRTDIYKYINPPPPPKMKYNGH